MDETIKLVWGSGGMLIDYANKSFPIYGIDNHYMIPFKSLVIDKSEAWKIYQIMKEIIDGKHDDELHIFASDTQATDAGKKVMEKYAKAIKNLGDR